MVFGETLGIHLYKWILVGFVWLFWGAQKRTEAPIKCTILRNVLCLKKDAEIKNGKCSKKLSLSINTNNTMMTSCISTGILQKGVNFVPPKTHQKQTWGLKFDTLGGSR